MSGLGAAGRPAGGGDVGAGLPLAGSCHGLGSGGAEAEQRSHEHQHADEAGGQELRPDDVEPGAAIEDRLREGDEMGRGRRPA